jgi:hypothetical protein
MPVNNIVVVGGEVEDGTGVSVGESVGEDSLVGTGSESVGFCFGVVVVYCTVGGTSSALARDVQDVIERTLINIKLESITLHLELICAPSPACW